MLRLRLLFAIVVSILLFGCGSQAPTGSTASPPDPAPAAEAPVPNVRWSVALEMETSAMALGGTFGEVPSAFALAPSQIVVVLSDGTAQTTSWRDITEPRALDADDTAVYYVDGSRLIVAPFVSGGEVAPIVIEGVETVSAIEAGYGGVVFVAGTDRVLAVSRDGQQTIAEGATVGTPSALLQYGGRLVVGDAADLRWLSLSSGEVEALAEGIGSVRGLAMDHIGYFVANVDGRGLVRVTPEGDVTDLDADVPAGPIAFDDRTRTLYVAGDGVVTALDYLGVVGDDPAVWAERDARTMGPFEIGGIRLAGAEYWPYRGDAEPDYPADILWGFYPEEGVVFEGEAAPATATPEAVACAEQSFAALREFVASAPEEFREATTLGPSARFYLWVNDYSQASDPFPHEMRPGRFWYWQRNPAVVGRVPGYWKWETTLTQSGECQIPQREQIAEYLEEKLRELRAAR